jgi:hypothetical protein
MPVNGDALKTHSEEIARIAVPRAVAERIPTVVRADA